MGKMMMWDTRRSSPSNDERWTKNDDDDVDEDDETTRTTRTNHEDARNRTPSTYEPQQPTTSQYNYDSDSTATTSATNATQSFISTHKLMWPFLSPTTTFRLFTDGMFISEMPITTNTRTHPQHPSIHTRRKAS